jgi:hypothetical protein
MAKITRKLIGTVMHSAPRGAYRTFCGKSVELAKDRPTGYVSEICSVCSEESDRELAR